MTSRKRAAVPGWNRTVIHSALALAFVNVAFVVPAAAVCAPANTTITTAVGKQMPCPGDTVTVTTSGSVSGSDSGGKGGFNAFEYTNNLSGALTNSGTISATPGAGVMDGWGVQINNDLSGSLTNNGTISVAPAAGGAVA